MNHKQSCEHTVVNDIWHALCELHAFLKCAALIEQGLPGEMTVQSIFPVEMLLVGYFI